MMLTALVKLESQVVLLRSKWSILYNSSVVVFISYYVAKSY